MKSYEKLLSDLNKIAKKQYGNPTKMADALEYSQSTISKMLNKKARPRIDTVCELLDKLGAQILFPGESPQKNQLHTSEGERIDELIAGMRKIGMRPEAIRDGVIREIEGMFEKKSSSDEDEERRLVG